MQIKYENKTCSGIKIIAEENGQEIGRAYLYLMNNDLHKRPLGFMEDVFVNEDCRGKGVGKRLVSEIINKAKENNCYKLICTSRLENEKVHMLYKKLGFSDYGKEFRINF
jgi:GNAT superfamily N-acetyltransferase